ncbi:hypothetical protein, partial [uncultured Dialister sp.]|uniref:hypothetical protein n=1 Tax=uncultured Dialister sp. TaxID=278064 RepID=UPI0025F2B7B8
IFTISQTNFQQISRTYRQFQATGSYFENLRGAMRSMALPGGRAMAFDQGSRCGASNYIAPQIIYFPL